MNGQQPAEVAADCERFNANPLLQPKIYGGILAGNRLTKLGQVSDGTSSTFLIGERGLLPQYGKWDGIPSPWECPWGLGDVVLPGTSRFFGGLRQPRNQAGDRLHWWSHHPGGTHFSLADGSVRFVPYHMDHKLTEKLTTYAGGEVVGDW